jgi:gamma-glutamylcyclotransferase (GGCT)/AIG2-like uncharacterized protein YtfP
LAPDAAALPFISIYLCRPLAELSIRDHTPFGLRDCGTANIYPAPDQGVWGTVYDVSAADLVILDTFEDGYRREILPVFALADGKQPLNSVVYVAEIESNVPMPNAEYKRLIVDGAKHWNLPPAYLSMLEAIQTEK